jgi:hypothetical protein
MGGRLSREKSPKLVSIQLGGEGTGHREPAPSQHKPLAGFFLFLACSKLVRLLCGLCQAVPLGHTVFPDCS